MKKPDYYLLLYIQKCIDLGISRDEITRDLIGAKWKEEDITEGFVALDAGGVVQERSGLSIVFRGITKILFALIFPFLTLYPIVMSLEVGGHRGQRHDAAIMSSVNHVRAQAELYYDDHSNSYKGVCEDDYVLNVIGSARGAGSDSIRCIDTNSMWALEAQLSVQNEQYYCVDSMGVATTTEYGEHTIKEGFDYNCGN